MRFMLASKCLAAARIGGSWKIYGKWILKPQTMRKISLRTRDRKGCKNCLTAVHQTTFSKALSCHNFTLFSAPWRGKGVSKTPLNDWWRSVFVNLKMWLEKFDATLYWWKNFRWCREWWTTPEQNERICRNCEREEDEDRLDLFVLDEAPTYGKSLFSPRLSSSNNSKTS